MTYCPHNQTGYCPDCQTHSEEINMNKCSQCETAIDTDNDMFYYSEIEGQHYCESCHDSDLQYGSTVLLAGPHFPSDSDGPVRIIVGEAFVEDKYGEDWGDLTFTRTYHRTDGWRGYWDTKIDGWTETMAGWTTGSWDDDPTSQRKATFNEWAEAMYEGRITPPVNVAIVADPTSNVFSTGIGVLVPEDKVEEFIAWIDPELENLRYALN